MLVFSTGENMVSEERPGADCGDKVSVSSRKGFVDLGRSGRVLDVAELTDGDRARLRNGLLDPRLTGDWGDP
jgi:hypothetical protein